MDPQRKDAPAASQGNEGVTPTNSPERSEHAMDSTAFEAHLNKKNLATLNEMCAEHGQENRAMAAATMHQMQIQEQESARLCAIANLQYPAADASRPAWFVGETPVFDQILLETHEVSRTWIRSFDVPDQEWSVAIVCDDVYNEEQEEWESAGPRIAVSVEEYTELDIDDATALGKAIADAVEALNGGTAKP